MKKQQFPKQRISFFFSVTSANLSTHCRPYAEEAEKKKVLSLRLRNSHSGREDKHITRSNIAIIIAILKRCSANRGKRKQF